MEAIIKDVNIFYNDFPLSLFEGDNYFNFLDYLAFGYNSYCSTAFRTLELIYLKLLSIIKT